MKLYVALMADARGYYCHVHGKANSWDEFHNQLEDLGVEVIENQTDDYDDWDEEEIYEDLIDINYLRTHTQTTYHTPKYLGIHYLLRLILINNSGVSPRFIVHLLNSNHD